MMATPAELFWDRHAPKYVAKPIADQPSCEAKLNHVRSLFQPADKVLEIGCGSGNSALRLATAPAAESVTPIHELCGLFTLTQIGHSQMGRSIRSWRSVCCTWFRKF